MSKKQKTTYYAIALGIFILVILWLLSKGTSATAATTAAATPATVDIPAFNLPPKSIINIPPMPGYPPINVSFPPVNIPGLPSDTFYNYNMRSACACGGSTVPYYQPQNAPPPPATVTLPAVTQPVYNGAFSGETTYANGQVVAIPQTLVI